eukprot:2439736-Rhodomonas_salina.2
MQAKAPDFRANCRSLAQRGMCHRLRDALPPQTFPVDHSGHARTDLCAISLDFALMFCEPCPYHTAGPKKRPALVRGARVQGARARLRPLCLDITDSAAAAAS